MRRHATTLARTIVAICALGAITATPAIATPPTISPTPEGKEFTISSGEGSIKGLGSTIACEKDKGSGKYFGGSGTSGPFLGTLTITFEKCKTAGGTSFKSLGDATGNILVFGEFHLATVDFPGTTLDLGFLILLPKLVHLEAGTVLFLLGGQLLLPFTGLTSGGEFHKSVAESHEESGKQAPKTCLEPTSLCSGKTWELYLEVEGSKGEAIEITKETFEFKETAYKPTVTF